MMREIIALFSVFLLCADCMAEELAIEDLQPDSKSKITFSVFLIKKVSKNKLSLDAAWEVYSVLIEGELKQEKLLTFICALSNFQISRPEMVGYSIRIKGPFIRECSEVLSIDRVTLLEKFTEKPPPDNNVEEYAVFDSRKLNLALGTKDLQKITEEGGAGQPTTAPELKSEGREKAQPESEVAPR